MPLFREKKETPGGLGAKGKAPDLYSSARRVQTTTKGWWNGWWNSASMRKNRRNFWKKLGKKAGATYDYMMWGE